MQATLRHGEFHDALCSAGRDRRGRVRPTARPHQHDARRLRQYLAEAHAAARAFAVHRHRRHHVHGVDYVEMSRRRWK